MSSFFTLLLWAWLMASSFIVSGHMVAFASPIATSAFRFLLALLILFPVLLFSWQRAGLSKAEQFQTLFSSGQRIFHYVVISGALVGFFIGLFVALQSTTPLNTSVLYTLVPLMGVFYCEGLVERSCAFMANSRVCSGIDWGCRCIIVYAAL